MDPNSPINPVNPNEQPAPQPTPTPQPAAQPIVQPQPVQPVVTQPVMQPMATQPVMQPMAAAPEPKKKSGKTIAIVVSIIASLIVIAVVAIILILNSSSNPLVGVWRDDYGGYTMEEYYIFRKDNTGTIMYGGKTASDFTYEFSGDKLTAKSGSSVTEMKVRFDDNKMTLTTPYDYAFGYTQTLVKISDDPNSVDTGSTKKVDVTKAQNDTTRREDMSKIMSQMSAYITNNRKAPYTVSTFETFIKNYVVSEKIENDPDGSKYSFKFNGECKSGGSSCWGSKNEKNTKKPTEFNHTVYYFNNATCSDDEVVYASGNKNVVIYYVLEEEDNVYCGSNN